MQAFGIKFPQWAVDIWAWLPWVAALCAGLVSFATNAISIWESKTFRGKIARWYNHRRAMRILRLRRELLEAEAESEL